MTHSYEEIRNKALEILSGRESVNITPDNYESLKRGIAEVLYKRNNKQKLDLHNKPILEDSDNETFLELFWELFRQGLITLGLNDSDRNFPFFRVSEFGSRINANQLT